MPVEEQDQSGVPQASEQVHRVEERPEQVRPSGNAAQELPAKGAIGHGSFGAQAHWPETQLQGIPAWPAPGEHQQSCPPVQGSPQVGASGGQSEGGNTAPQA